MYIKSNLLKPQNKVYENYQANKIFEMFEIFEKVSLPKGFWKQVN